MFNFIQDFISAPSNTPLRYQRYYVASSTIYLIGSIVHFAFLIFFAWIGAREMMYFNIFSVHWFLFVIWVNRKGYLTLACYLAFAEVFTHAALCAHYFGWDSGFPYYSFLFSTAIFILPPNKIFLKFLSITLGALIFAGMYYYTQANEPVYKWESPYIEFSYIANVTTATLILAGFAYYFTLSANKAEETIEMLLQKEVEREAKEKEFIKDVFGKVVDYRIRDYLLENKEFQMGKNLEATVLFMDIRGFTKFSESKNPRDVVVILNRLFEKMNKAINNHGGAINKFMGDSILALFNVPIEIQNHADSAFNAALEMFHELENLNEELIHEGVETLNIGIGIHTGIVLAGNVGSENRLEYTVIGDTVNTASRLEKATKVSNAKLLISEITYNKIQEKSNIRFIGKIKVRGKKEGIKVYGV